MKAEDKILEEVLAEITVKEKRAFRRANVFTIIPILVGVVLISISSLQVLRLNRTKAALSGEVGALTMKKDAALEELVRIDQKRVKAEENLDRTTKALYEIQRLSLNEIDKGTKDPKGLARKAFGIASEATKVVKKQKETDRASEPAKGQVTEPQPKSAAPDNKEIGFIDEYHYRGRDKTNISVEVKAQGQSGFFTYALDGAPMQSPSSGRFSFTLDKSKHDSSRLLLLLDFLEPDEKGYTITVRASDGSVSRIVVLPKGKVTRTIGYYFEII